MYITSICATKGRHHLLERSIKFFLDQDYEGEHTLLIFNNSEVKQSLGISEPGICSPTYWGNMKNKSVILVNKNIDSKTGLPYTNLGAIYNDALQYVGSNCDVIQHWDDDDIFLPGHLRLGAIGLYDSMLFGGKAYKPAQSYYRHAEGVMLTANNLEPSIFVLADHIRKYGYSLTTTEQHLQWLEPLRQEGSILVTQFGTPTLVYNWGDANIPTWKTSGDPNNPKNFDNYTNFSQDHGNQVITPWTDERAKPYYDQIKEFNELNSQKVYS